MSELTLSEKPPKIKIDFILAPSLTFRMTHLLTAIVILIKFFMIVIRISTSSEILLLIGDLAHKRKLQR